MKSLRKKTLSVSEFKAKALAILDKLSQDGEEITITKRGKPIAKVVAYNSSVKPVPGKLAASVVAEKDVVSPLGAKMWKATQ